MYRLMQPSDEAAVLALWQSQHHDTEDFAKMVLERFAGMQNIYVADENDAIVAAALAVPVTLQGRTGNYLCLCGEGSLLLAGLLDTLCAHQKLRGAGFTVTVPADGTRNQTASADIPPTAPAEASSTGAPRWRWCSGRR